MKRQSRSEAVETPVDPGVCRRLLRWLVDYGERTYREERAYGTLPDTTAALHQHLVTVYSPVQERALEALVAKNILDLGRQFIHAPPILKGSPILLPVVQVMWSFSSGQPGIAVRVGLFDGTTPVARPRAVGWRFESAGGDGMHDYC